MKTTHTTSRTDNQRLRKHRNRTGATLVEALLALTIFAVFITGACKLLVAQRKILDTAREHYTAANIAKNRIELVRTFDFDQLPALNETSIRVDHKGIPSTVGNFLRVTTVDTVSSNFYELAVTVKMKNRMTLDFDGGEETINTAVALHL